MPGIWQPHDTITDPELRISAEGVSLNVTASTDLTWNTTKVAEGVVEVRITPNRPNVVRVGWQVPCVDVAAFWTPDSGEHRGLPPFWRKPRTASLERNAPVGCLVGVDDLSVCTFAVREVVEPVRVRTGVVEETGEFGFWVEHLASPESGLVLLLDFSGRHFARTLSGVASWWGADREVPWVARMPAYSTWYAMQQHVTAESVERQAGLAVELGMDAIIVDDGWHSSDRGRGYGYVGEWSPAFDDFSGHIAKARGEGLAYLLWYALPFVGRHTALWDSVSPYLLAYKEHMNAGILDPRYPHIRALLASALTRAVTEWGADGLKIDFIDQFAVESPPSPGPTADCSSVTEGVRRLLELLPRDCLVELRQPYVSPGLWPYATMIRASDCPLSPLHNRQRTVDLRLVCGPLAVHADMLMWHPADSPARVAAQLINVLFAVPQISVDLHALTAEQASVVRFWLAFFRTHASVLQLGTFTPSRPDLHYPLVTASDGSTTITARYAPLPVPVPAFGTLWLANADSSSDVLLSVPSPCTAGVTVFDCRGQALQSDTVSLSGIHPVPVPTGGLLRIQH